MVSWYHFTSLKCGSAEGQWDIVVDGTYDLGGGTLVLTGSGTATLTKDQATKRFLGPWNAAFAVRLEGVPSAIGGQDGTLDGNAELVNHATLNLVGVNAQGTFFAQTPAKSIGGQADNPGKDFFLPVTNGRFC